MKGNDIEGDHTKTCGEAPMEVETRMGTMAGMQWARFVASEGELVSLSEAMDHPDFLEGFPDGNPWPRLVYRAIRPYSEVGDVDHEAACFWNDFGVSAPSYEWLRGFCNGAIGHLEADPA